MNVAPKETNLCYCNRYAEEKHITHEEGFAKQWCCCEGNSFWLDIKGKKDRCAEKYRHKILPSALNLEVKLFELSLANIAEATKQVSKKQKPKINQKNPSNSILAREKDTVIDKKIRRIARIENCIAS